MKLSRPVLPAGTRVVLAFVGHYLPGYKAGGIARSMINTVDQLGDEFAFFIVTRDRDMGDDVPYANVRLEQWQPVGKASVYYMQPGSLTLRGLSAIITGTAHDTLYLGSFFDRFTISVLLLRTLGRIQCDHIVVAPRGEFGWGSLRLKYPKKLLFIMLARLIGLYRGVTWHASDEREALDIARIMKIMPAAIRIAQDLAAKAPNEQPVLSSGEPTRRNGLCIVFLSRIAREKNLDYALKVLRETKSRIVFDIYGPLEDTRYWDECQQLIGQLPANVAVSYQGPVSPAEVTEVFSCYDLFFFPTSGENYGHVIPESLVAGTPVLISTETPWRNLQAEGLGWDLALSDSGAFVEVIEAMASASENGSRVHRTEIRAKALKRLTDPGVVEANRMLYRHPSSAA